MSTQPVIVITSGWQFSIDGGGSASCATAKLYGDQPADRIATNKRRHVNTIVEDNLPELLRTLAEWCEQEGVTNTAEYEERMTAALAAAGEGDR